MIRGHASDKPVGAIQNPDGAATPGPEVTR